jgi:glycosyltransferase involved in cell wall biosynthesis
MGAEVLESYTSPETARTLALEAGMDFVTLTDHESVDGALAIAHHSDVVVGAEISTVFPEDGTSADVLVFGLDRAILTELQILRPNATRLVAFLRDTGLPFVLAHPMFEMHGALDRAAVERRMALFPLWEAINGSRPGDQNRLAAALAADCGDLRIVASRHGLPFPGHRRIASTAGSDDHAGLYPGSAYTVIPRAYSPADVLAALQAGAVRPIGEDGSPSTLVSTGMRLAGHAATARLADDPQAGTDPSEPPGLMQHLPLLAALPPGLARRALTGRYEARLREAIAAFSGGSLAMALGSVGRVVEAHALAAPFVGVHVYWGSERRKATALSSRLGHANRRNPRIGIFVDGFGAVHGVSTFYRNVLDQERSPSGAVLELVRCGDEPEADLRPVGSLPLPLYESAPLPVPSLPDLLDLIADREFDALHVATPGPLGIAALTAAHILGLPVVGGYHTEFGAYARTLANDRMFGDVVETAVRAFYGRCAAIAAPSAATAQSLRARGLPADRILVLGNGVDAERFHPRFREEATRENLGGGTLLVYAGRVSREKGLPDLADGFRRLRERRSDVRLVVIGDGPFRAEMQSALGNSAVFTGFLHGEAFARMLASCDLFLFPSETDTLGRAVIEAQACGLPAVVKTGGPAECVVPGESGLVVECGNGDSFWEAVERLLDDPERRHAMGLAARRFAEQRSWGTVRSELDALYDSVLATQPSSLPASSAASRAAERNAVDVVLV